MAKPLSDTQAQILAVAAHHQARLATPRSSLPAAARNAVFRSLINGSLLEEVPAPAEHHDLGWRQEEGEWIGLRITEIGLQAIGIVSEAATKPAYEVRVTPPTTTTARVPLREAATALLGAWDAGLEPPALPTAMEALRAALAGPRGQSRPPRDPSAHRTPREGTKQQATSSPTTSRIGRSATASSSRSGLGRWEAGWSMARSPSPTPASGATGSTCTVTGSTGLPCPCAAGQRPTHRRRCNSVFRTWTAIMATVE
jgi:hypothetical protein